MKNIVTKLLIAATFALLSISCLKDPSHSIRIENKYTEAMADIKINSASYGRIQTGSTTDYIHVDEGDFTVSGSTDSGLVVTGSGSVSGKGTHKWTLLISVSGSISMSEDK